MALATQSIHFVDSDYTSDFRVAVPGNGTGAPDTASMYADLQFAQGVPANLGDMGKAIVKSIRLLSIENVTYRVDFYDRSVPVATAPANMNLQGLIGSVALTPPGGAQPSSSYFATAYKIGTLFAYFAEGLDIPVIDKTGKGQLHVNLVNISATAKSAGDVGAVQLRVGTVFAS